MQLPPDASRVYCKMWLCPHCLTENFAAAVICLNCSRRLNQEFHVPFSVPDITAQMFVLGQTPILHRLDTGLLQSKDFFRETVERSDLPYGPNVRYPTDHLPVTFKPDRVILGPNMAGMLWDELHAVDRERLGLAPDARAPRITREQIQARLGCSFEIMDTLSCLTNMAVYVSPIGHEHHRGNPSYFAWPLLM